VSFKRIVIKLGTSTLTAGTNKINPPRILEVVRQVAALRGRGLEVMLVSSGAMAAGREALSFPDLPRHVPAKQMLAAIGQPRLMALYGQLFGLYALTAAQVLLTRADLGDRRRYLNARNALSALLSNGVIPIINENDTVATEEIRVGDNDNLSALVATLIDADLLVLLTDQAGLYSADPRRDPGAVRVAEVNEPTIPDSLWEAAGGTASGLGTGGMLTKLQAADLARRAGCTVLIASGTAADVVLRAAAGEMDGTWFRPTASSMESRKRYILSGGSARGGLVVDAGAARALRAGGSLLPIGVSTVTGEFDRGDTVRILDAEGREVARGISNYGSADLARLCRRHSDEIDSVLGFHYGDEVVHRDDLVMV
jgi:glutamate 5-kinase